VRLVRRGSKQSLLQHLASSRERIRLQLERIYMLMSLWSECVRTNKQAPEWSHYSSHHSSSILRSLSFFFTLTLLLLRWIRPNKQTRVFYHELVRSHACSFLAAAWIHQNSFVFQTCFCTSSYEFVWLVEINIGKPQISLTIFCTLLRCNIYNKAYHTERLQMSYPRLASIARAIVTHFLRDMMNFFSIFGFPFLNSKLHRDPTNRAVGFLISNKCIYLYLCLYL